MATPTLDTILSLSITLIGIIAIVLIVVVPMVLLGFWIQTQLLKKKIINRVKGGEFKNGIQEENTNNRTSSTGNEGGSARNLSQYRTGEVETRKYLLGANKPNSINTGSHKAIKLH